MKNKGFTLIELMIVVVIIGILAAIAIPNYNQFTRKAKRQEAVTALNELQQAQAKLRGNCRWYAESTGAANDCAATAAASTVAFTTTPENYTIAITAGSASGNAYTAIATAQGTQVADTDCIYIALIVDNTTPNGDMRTSSDISGTPDTTNECL
jgi:type IV pilus assembly protein PilE